MVSQLKRLIRAYMPLWLVRAMLIGWRFVNLPYHYLYDLCRYAKWSTALGYGSSHRQMYAELVKNYHRIEKGLALPAPRVDFGADFIPFFPERLARYIDRYGVDPLCELCIGCLERYIEYNDGQGGNSHGIRDQVSRLRAQHFADRTPEGGTLQIRASDFNPEQVDFERFAASRYSVRDFADTPVEMAQINDAIRAALKTPSVCNRQSWKVYVSQSEASRDAALAIQQGNAGFGHTASNVIVVCYDMQDFMSVGERYQGWIDGGMFMMSLVYALHAQSIGSCVLNWSVESWYDRALSKAWNIPANERVVGLIAVGNLKDEFSVAVSKRKDIEQIVERV